MNERRYREFRWLERGTGEPVVLLHGLMSRPDHWEGVLEGLSDVCRPIAPSLPIFDSALREPSIRELALFVRDFLDAIEIPRAVVGGNSLGGHVTLALALAHPERVSGLVLTGSSGLLERSSTGRVPHRPSPAYVRERMREIVFDSGLITAEWVDSVHELVSTPFSALRVVRLARAARRERLDDRLAEIRVPTLLIWGCDDRITPPETARAFQGLLSDAELVLIPSCGHAPMLERPRRFAEAVEEWLLITRARRDRMSLVAGSLR
jgi:pimeloyl-ACP methyl ester carboxylesterase